MASRYCGSADVQSRLASIEVGGDTAVNVGDMLRFIDAASARIDAVLAANWVVPVTAEAALEVLKPIAAVGAAYMCFAALSTGGEEGDFPWQTDFYRALDRLASGAIQLPGVPRKPSTVVVL